MNSHRFLGSMLVLTVGVLLLGSSSVGAQGYCLKEGTGLYHYLIGGASLHKMDALNESLDELTPSITDEVSSWSGDVGFGSHMRINRIILGHQLYMSLWQHMFDEAQRTTFYSWVWTFDAGFNVLPPDMFPNLQVYPRVGLGAGLMRLHVREDEAPWDTYLSREATQDPLWQPAFLFDFSAAADYTFSLPVLYKDILLGLRVGFLLQPGQSSDWYSNGVQFEDGPDQTLTSLYIHGVIGFAHIGKGRR